MIAQEPMKSLFWFRMRQLHGNSPGDVSPCPKSATGLNSWVPHAFTPVIVSPYTCVSWHPCTHGSDTTLVGGTQADLPNTDMSTVGQHLPCSTHGTLQGRRWMDWLLLV